MKGKGGYKRAEGELSDCDANQSSCQSGGELESKNCLSEEPHITEMARLVPCLLAGGLPENSMP